MVSAFMPIFSDGTNGDAKTVLNRSFSTHTLPQWLFVALLVSRLGLLGFPFRHDDVVNFPIRFFSPLALTAFKI